MWEESTSTWICTYVTCNIWITTVCKRLSSTLMSPPGSDRLFLFNHSRHHHQKKKLFRLTDRMFLHPRKEHLWQKLSECRAKSFRLWSVICFLIRGVNVNTVRHMAREPGANRPLTVQLKPPKSAATTKLFAARKKTSRSDSCNWILLVMRNRATGESQQNKLAAARSRLAAPDLHLRKTQITNTHFNPSN